MDMPTNTPNLRKHLQLYCLENSHAHCSRIEKEILNKRNEEKEEDIALRHCYNIFNTLQKILFSYNYNYSTYIALEE